MILSKTPILPKSVAVRSSIQPPATQHKPDDLYYVAAGKPISYKEHEEMLAVSQQEEALRKLALRQYEREGIKAAAIGAGVGLAVGSVVGAFSQNTGLAVAASLVGAIAGGRFGLACAWE